MKNIIVPIDFSPKSEIALKVAAKLAKQSKAELLVLHMLELSPAISGNTEYLPQAHIVHLMKITEKRFNDFLSKPYLKDIKVTPIIKHYRVFSEVDDVAKKHDADLIVMGSNGADGLEEIFIGSNTERVVRDSVIPVLVIKGETAQFKVERFVFACDFKQESIAAAKKAIAFADRLGAKLRMVFINTPADNFLSTEDVQKRISKFMNVGRLSLDVDIYNDYTVEKGILNYAETNGADLIGIPTHGRTGLAHFFMGSIGEDIANHSKIPVITFKI
ncbi:UspA domain-containing protein [Croceitalea dokdonensis DOKDO 023]|uniref:UspA domain-containing protein n=1 Tax=Croceitalea dokdonensis DOKDO 023 TaxID=1300341 RepID=A0A0P7AY50_9FLAO|nr:universal stress protein [Croceitalea dokdonensis]KPM31271.1 UspA domain-containing protein [Croceitalea dokdonensis DOKDO 023]